MRMRMQYLDDPHGGGLPPALCLPPGGEGRLGQAHGLGSCKQHQAVSDHPQDGWLGLAQASGRRLGLLPALAEAFIPVNSISVCTVGTSCRQ